MSNLLTISYGDYPDLMEATLRILMEAGTVFEIEAVQIGEEMKKLGFEKGFDEDVLRKIRCSRVLFKGVNSEVKTSDLCEVFEIDNAPESFGENNAALAYVSDDYAIFEPATNSAMAVLNAAILLLKHMQQVEAVERIQKAISDITLSDNVSADEFADVVIAKLY